MAGRTAGSGRLQQGQRPQCHQGSHRDRDERAPDVLGLPDHPHRDHQTENHQNRKNNGHNGIPPPQLVEAEEETCPEQHSQHGLEDRCQGVPQSTEPAALGAIAAIQQIGREDVKLKDITTLEEAPRMGCGIMELTDGASFEWTLTYDEYDIVLEGNLEIEIDGRIVAGGPGDVIYIPKGSHIHFQTPDRAKYAYTVYPANWQEG